LGQQQREAIDYLREENRVLRQQLGNKRLHLNDGQRRRDAGDGSLTGKRYLIHDRDPLFTAEFLGTLAVSGVKSVKLPPRSPNLNAHAERSVRTIKESCLDRMLLFGEGSLRKTIREFVAHYHGGRNHQGLGNRLIIPDESHAGNGGAIRRRERLGGMLDYYYRQAP
jgi:transposase InsO family protein